ncbi:MAG: CvpA family protein, partial [Pseudomonadota bacterium]
DLSLIIFIGAIAFFVYRGYSRGLLKSLSRIVGLIAGYAAAIVFSNPLSQQLGPWLQVQGMIAYISAAVILFFGAGVLISILFWLIGKAFTDSDAPSGGSRIGGALIGLFSGTVVAIILVWTFNFVQQMRGAETAGSSDNDNPVTNIAKRVAGKAVGTAMSLGSADPEVVQLSTAMAAAPGKITQRAQRLINSPEFQDLLHDPKTRELLRNGNSKALQDSEAFQKLVKNPDLIALAESTGLVDSDDQDPARTEALLAQKFSAIWGRAERVKDNPRVREILSDPEFQQKLNSGNPLDLLSNGELLELTNIILSDEAAASSDTPGSSDSNTQQKTQTKVYSWTDSTGRIHYSDSPPEGVAE